jgi:endonuclease III related protein
MSTGVTASTARPGVSVTLEAIFAELDTMHRWRGWHWWPDADPFEVCVGAILVQNTSWTNVERALEELREAGALHWRVMAALEPSELERLIRSSGQYRQKAKKLRAFLDRVEQHGTLEALLTLPPDVLREQLLSTWGIGPETADAILLYAARHPAFAIDAYAIRIFRRLGIGPVYTADYDTWQQFFVSHLLEDRDAWSQYRALIVLHAKHLCRKHRPRCGECTLASRCNGPGI